MRWKHRADRHWKLQAGRDMVSAAEPWRVRKNSPLNEFAPEGGGGKSGSWRCNKGILGQGSSLASVWDGNLGPSWGTAKCTMSLDQEMWWTKEGGGIITIENIELSIVQILEDSTDWTEGVRGPRWSRAGGRRSPVDRWCLSKHLDTLQHFQFLQRILWEHSLQNPAFSSIVY